MGNCFSFQIGCDELITRCCGCIAIKANFVCHLEENIQALWIAKDVLVAQKADVMRRIRLGETEEMERLPQVVNWLGRVDALVAEVNQLLGIAPQETSKLFLGGCCSSSYTSSYKFGKEVAQKLKEVRDEKDTVFPQVVGPAPPRPVVKRNVEPTVGMETTFDRAWRLLMDDHVDTLGIWGMGGVGKSTLLNKINNEFLKEPHDYVVIYVVVSSTFTIEKVQDDVWKKMGFSVDDSEWTRKSRQEKAASILYMMNRKKFVLLLDNVWEPINLADDIGVPEERNGSKVVFTTRDEAVCGQMDADKQIKVEALSWKKAWELFQNKVGQDTLNSHPDIPSLAQRVAKECAGLPIALITVARSMARKKTPHEWKDDSERLRTSASHFQGMNKVLALLKFSYERLPDDTTRSCFLYCCLFPEDYKIPKCDLVDYWVGEGFCTNPRNGYGYIGTLVRACLLEEEGENVKLHDVVRDMALWIACECQDQNERFLVETGRRLTEIRDVGNWKAMKRISVMDNKITDLRGAPVCPNLETVFLCHNEVIETTGGGFFRSMDALRVLDLSWNPRLRSFKRLSLDFSALKSLHYLNISNTDIRELPLDFKELVNLKYLNLDNTLLMEMMPRKVLSSLSMLQVLRMYKCSYCKTRVDEDSIWSDGNLLVEELQCLKHLTLLTTTIRSASSLEILSSKPELFSCIQSLCLMDDTGSKSMSISPFADIAQLEELLITAVDMEELSVGSGGIQRTVSVNRSFNSLRRVEAVNCHRMLDFTWLVLVPNLSELNIRGAHSMREIISHTKFHEISQQFHHPFAKLELLWLDGLPHLESIYRSPLPVPSLRKIYVHKCPNLKKLPLDSKSARGCNLIIKGEDDWWKNLEWESEPTKTTFSTYFVSLV